MDLKIENKGNVRRLQIVLTVLILFAAGCSSPFIKKTDSFAERESIGFQEWGFPHFFIPEVIRIVGLGDSLTQGIGDERKKDGYFGRVTSRMNNWQGIEEVETANLAKRGRRSEQLIKALDDPEVQLEIRQADMVFMTIGGNDIMKVVKGNLFDLKTPPFYKELGKFESKLDEIFGTIRGLNDEAVIVISGLYNPVTLVTDEVKEFENIITDWNETMKMQVLLDGNSCFVPVTDLFESNETMVYHTDFFHPNARGYDLMTDRFLQTLESCESVRNSGMYSDW